MLSHMEKSNAEACEAWRLLLKFFFSQRARIPTIAAEFELSPVQCQVLHLVEPGQPISMRRIAETLACDASNVTGLVDRLESRGLVERRSSIEDRRIKVLGLTRAGSRVRSLLLKRLTQPPDALARLSAEEQRTLARILRRLVV